MLLNILDGSKTYIVAVVIIIMSVLKGLGYIDENTYQTVIGILVGAGFGALKSAIKKCE